MAIYVLKGIGHPLKNGSVFFFVHTLKVHVLDPIDFRCMDKKYIYVCQKKKS